ncbi:NAD(P)H dehydrogenase (quinone) [Salegentibacter echinorum]|uniref:NAD(P)H dehydrogenase (Quinone) n=1 Tax=Salegentibacter echinorum TaxID=1073325 RepID=A0A1M5FM15_SALEC|nr:NAD(P)H:quinone oxidoreductase [Salegentibacter echinorum]SHF92474.1 NAD(P)H dehydrogenase (quinone) [Salegentibacter echinorum]
MSQPKVAVIFYSATGTNHQLAQWAGEAAKNAGAAEVRVKRIKETAPQEAIDQNEAWKNYAAENKDFPTVELDDLLWADAIIFSTPTRYGNLPSQLQAFFDTTGGLWSSGKLTNKIVSGMTSAANHHGGQEATLLSLYKTIMHWGSIIVAPGYTDSSLFEAGGNPYGVSVTASGNTPGDNIKKAVEHQVKRTVEMAAKFKD